MNGAGWSGGLSGGRTASLAFTNKGCEAALLYALSHRTDFAQGALSRIDTYSKAVIPAQSRQRETSTVLPVTVFTCDSARRACPSLMISRQLADALASELVVYLSMVHIIIKSIDASACKKRTLWFYQTRVLPTIPVIEF